MKGDAGADLHDCVANLEVRVAICGPANQNVGDGRPAELHPDLLRRWV